MILRAAKRSRMILHAAWRSEMITGGSKVQQNAAARGFTLIELMVSMALGLLLLAGAFEMHASFSRQSVHQQETADMQQALRVGAQVIGQAARTAGSGLSGGLLDLYDSASPTGLPAW